MCNEPKVIAHPISMACYKIWPGHCHLHSATAASICANIVVSSFPFPDCKGWPGTGHGFVHAHDSQNNYGISALEHLLFNSSVNLCSAYLYISTMYSRCPMATYTCMNNDYQAIFGGLGTGLVPGCVCMTFKIFMSDAIQLHGACFHWQDACLNLPK